MPLSGQHIAMLLDRLEPPAPDPPAFAAQLSRDLAVRLSDRPDAGGISIEKARRVLGYAPEHTWRAT